MEMISLQYKGGRSLVKSYYNRQCYIFKRDNNYIAEVPVELAKQLLITKQYLPVVKPQEPVKIETKETVVIVEDNLVCQICGFKAKSEQGMLVHSAKHKREERNG